MSRGSVSRSRAFVEVHKQQDPRQSLESEQKLADDHRFNEILNPKMVLNLLVI